MTPQTATPTDATSHPTTDSRNNTNSANNAQSADSATPASKPQAPDPRAFTRFADFYPFYLSEHSNRTCRRLHFVGSTLTLVCLGLLIATGKPQYLLLGLLCGYGFAWVGHFGFEKNKPASFKRPLYSFMGDWTMYKDIWIGKVRL